MTSDEAETPDNCNLATVQTYDRPRRDDNIRSGIKDLLDANREAPVVDANTATVLETLLSQMNKGSSERLVPLLSSDQMSDSIFRSLTNHGPAAGVSSRVRTRAMFVGCLNA